MALQLSKWRSDDFCRFEGARAEEHGLSLAHHDDYSSERIRDACAQRRCLMWHLEIARMSSDTDTDTQPRVIPSGRQSLRHSHTDRASGLPACHRSPGSQSASIAAGYILEDVTGARNPPSDPPLSGTRVIFPDTRACLIVR